MSKGIKIKQQQYCNISYRSEECDEGTANYGTKPNRCDEAGDDVEQKQSCARITKILQIFGQEALEPGPSLNGGESTDNRSGKGYLLYPGLLVLVEQVRRGMGEISKIKVDF